MNKKVLFFYPNTTNHPAIASAVPILSGIAKKHGWYVSYFDTSDYQKPMDATEEKEITGGFMPGFTTVKKEMIPDSRLVPDLQDKIDEVQPDVIAISVMSDNYQYLMTFWGEIVIPEKTVMIIGGIHAIVCSDEVIETKLFDLVCTGQGEEVFEELLDRVEHDMNIGDIDGTWFYDRVDKVCRNPMRMLSKNVWNIDPDYSIYDDRYFTYPFDGEMVGMCWINTSRGCPYDCSYCGNSVLRRVYKGLGKYIYSKPIESVFRTLTWLCKNHKIDVVNITDECFLAHNKEWLEEFAERYSEHVKIPFLIQTRMETVTRKNLDILLTCGAPFFQVGTGVESGSERILFDVCNRRTKIKDIIKAYDLLNEYGIRSNAYFMIGLPYETREDIFKTIDLCRCINSTINVVSIFQPLPGQRLTELCLKEGFITGREPFTTFTGESVLKMPQISAEEISNLRRTFMLYAKLPVDYYHEIEKCEKDYENNRYLFKELVEMRWHYEKNRK